MNWKNEVIDKLRNYNAHRAALLHEGRVRQLGTPEELYRGEALEQVRGTARKIGDGLDQSLNPRQQERKTSRQYGRR